MKNCFVKIIGALALLALLSSLNPQLSACFAQGTAFTYQGRLNDGTNPANGSYQFTFGLFDAASGGTQHGATITTNPLGVTNGLFTIILDFGNQFPADLSGPVRWLEISARTNGAATFSTLTPRQELTATPYAITAENYSGVVNNSQLANNSLTITAGTGLGGGGTVALGGSTTLNNAGVISVTGNADITAANSGGAVTLGDTATSTNIASTIVKRDAGSSFSARDITLSGILIMPSAVGEISDSTNPLLYCDGPSGNVNTSLGFESLMSKTTGIENTAVGGESLFSDTSGADNVAVGAAALKANVVGNYSTAVGAGALDQATGSYNIALGSSAGYLVLTGSNNIEIGNNGMASDNKTIRIGTVGTQTNTFVAGIYGETVASGVAVYVDSSGQLGVLSSSQKYKQEIRAMGDASDVLLALRPVTFKYQSAIDPAGTPQFGLIAEQVEKVDPALVVHDTEHGIYTVRYQAVDAMLLNEFLKQHRTAQEQQATIQSQSAEIADLKARLEKLETLSHSRKDQNQ